jgi:hypothetical protein
LYGLATQKSYHVVYKLDYPTSVAAEKNTVNGRKPSRISAPFLFEMLTCLRQRGVAGYTSTASNNLSARDLEFRGVEGRVQGQGGIVLLAPEAAARLCPAAER